MPMRPPRRLPRRLLRPVSPQTRLLVERRYERHRKHRWDVFRRVVRRFAERVVALRAYAIAAGVGVIILGLSSFFAIAIFSPVMRVTEVRVLHRDPRLDLEHVQSLLSPLFGKHLLLLSAYDVRTLLYEGVPDLASVDVRKDYPSTLEVRLALDPLVARVAILVPDQGNLESGTGAIIDYLTQKGVYISSSRIADGGSLPLMSLVDWGARPTVGSQILPPALLEQIFQTEEELLEQFGQEVLHRTIFLRAREYHVETAQWDLWFDTRSSLDEQMQRYRTFMREIPHTAVHDYIDLRLKDRVVYK